MLLDQRPSGVRSGPAGRANALHNDQGRVRGPALVASGDVERELDADYQLVAPLDGQPPLPTSVHERVNTPLDAFVMLKVFGVFAEFAVTV